MTLLMKVEWMTYVYLCMIEEKLLLMVMPIVKTVMKDAMVLTKEDDDTIVLYNWC